MAYFWTAFNWDDYDRKTSHLPMLRHGAYVLLLKHYYRTRKPLEANAKQLLFICRANTTEEIEAVNAVLAEFFVLRDGAYHHERCDEEIARANEISEKRARSGAKGGAQRGKANAKQVLSNCDTSTSTTTNTNSWGNGEFHQLQYAAHVLEELGLPDTKLLKETIAAAIVAKANDSGNPKEASARWLIAQAQSYKNSSEFKSNKRKNWINWFANANYDDDPAKWEQIDGKNQGVRVERISAQSARIERNRQASADFLREIYPDIAVAEPGGGTVPPRHTNGPPDAVLAEEPVILPPRSH